MYDTELFRQEDGSYGFLELLLSQNSDECQSLNGVMLVQSGWYIDPVSTHHPYRSDQVRTGWSEGVDRSYVIAAIDKVCEEFHEELDKDRVYVTGYSNGGFFVMELWNHFPSRFKGVCNYCGGLSSKQCLKYYGIPHLFWQEQYAEVMRRDFSFPDSSEAWSLLDKWDYTLSGEEKEEQDSSAKGKLLIITGLKDENRTPCFRTLVSTCRQIRELPLGETTFKRVDFSLRKEQHHEVLKSDALVSWIAFQN
eukprot:TRINITY_DN1053_c0_g2_i1.p1 TRINITY_DN1053_c0_g2~~TRINITY_DN1053_c0_g2_i1.p1  ORF type:complete len:269 (-),score=59.39 TRINITY_DN1053_c0_g2_i1:162-914(-)